MEHMADAPEGYDVISVQRLSDAKRYIRTKRCSCGEGYMIITVETTEVRGETCDLYRVVCKGCGRKRDLVFRLDREERAPPSTF